tara:strand:- start:703 stop:954 length:252 start_codon:yes stop_codon:yes gene_type:complete
MSDYYETDLLIWENKQDTIHREWSDKYEHASIEAFKNRGKKESDIIYLEWANDLDEVLYWIKEFQDNDKLKIRVTKYKRDQDD